MGSNRMSYRAGWHLLLLAMLVTTALPALAAPAAAAPTDTTAVRVAQATTSTIQLSVVSARTEPRAFGGAGVTKGATIGTYKYIINIDNTGTTDQRPDPSTGALPAACTPADPNYPASCKWVSIAGVPGSSPIYTQGNQADFAGGMNLPNGRYLISVLADGYKLDGAHFTVPLAAPGVVTVELQPTPLPEATIRAYVFEDISPTNSAPDEPAEHGLAGFVGHITDYIGEVTTDIYGNPLCTQYEGEDPATFAIPASALDPDGVPIPVPGTGGQCVSDATGMLAIPHVGPNRYALSAVPPDGSNWIQTTTLEGNHDWDAWVMEGATGYDTEFVVAGEPFPAIFFGFVHPTSALPSGGSGTITGLVAAVTTYVPAKGGIVGGEPMIGSKVDHVIEYPWLSLSNLGAGDTAQWIGQGNADGTFTIPNVPDGTYTLAYWDEPQDYILLIQNITIANGETVDVGMLPLAGWWQRYEGHVFLDSNGNGVMDPGESGLPGFPVVMKKRENSVMDRGATLVTTDADGHYFMENAYPMTQWLVMEAYSDLYKTTGVTYQADNQPEETTVLGAGVDVSVLPIIGLGGRLDWGVQPYAANENGGIVGTVSYDTTRNELDPRYAAVEDWQPGVSNVPVYLYAPVLCHTNAGAACDATGRYELAADGSFAKGKLLNSYLTETWTRPQGCVARDVNGNPLVNGVDEQVLPLGSDTPGNDKDCLEGPMLATQFGPYPTDQGTPDANFGAAVDGNYGFGDMCTGALDATDPANPVCNGGAFSALTAGDYLVDVAIPNDTTGRPLFKVTKEEDINIANGDQFVPQVPPAECAGPLHTVDVAGIGADNVPAIVGNGANGVPTGVTVPASTPVDNATFRDNLGGSVYEGQPRPLCTTKLVTVSNGRSTAPTFNVFTDVPVPGRFWGLIVDDLNFSSNPKSLLYGEKAGVPFAPVGIYDWTNRLIYTAESDFNGLFDVLLPSTNRISCPTPSGVCANLYRFVGNDPGTPGHLNLNYSPQFRTIAAEFEAFPGLIVPADLAPTQMGATTQLPGGQFNSPVACTVEATRPQLFAVSQPYADLRGGNSVSITLRGQAFGATQGSGRVTLDGVTVPVTSWSDTQIVISIATSTAVGPHQLLVQANSGARLVNGLTFHVINNGGFGAMPQAGVLDNFNRTATLLGANWRGDVTNTNTFQILSNTQAQVKATGNAWWNATFGQNQEAYFTFTKVSTSGTEQGLLLKFNGTNATGLASTWVAVVYNRVNNTVQVRTKSIGSLTPSNVGSTIAATFAANDQLGARVLSTGEVQVFKNGALIGSRSANAAFGLITGAIGVRFTGATTTNDARFDNFGGGTITAGASYAPSVYEVGPGKPYATIQSAIDAATLSLPDDLVVVYPGTPDLTNPRVNPRGAYYENLIVTSPIKLQGVGPGGVIAATNTTVPGSVIDGSAFAGDTALADAWRARIAGLTWVGNQPTEMSEGEVILLLARTQTQYGSTFKAAIDGFDIRGGDQQGTPNNVTQGGAIYAHAYIRNLQVTNNVIENNNASYGVIRSGTPDLPAPDTSQHNENLRIAYNRILANGSTNLAGGIGIFAGADGYEVANNDLCGNFSAEYGGGMTVYGLSPSGKIHDNRFYYNQSYDEGGAILIGGQLPANPTSLSPGSGAVDIYNNLVQSNMANDDGGGLRFLMAGNFPMNVYNNMIVNNISTHEGGGVALDDAPNVRFYNNTVMKNITTATAVTSNGFPAPAGLSTGANSSILQATLPAGSPGFSNPLLFNNIFYDNRAGTAGLGTVTGIGAAGDLTAINLWDLGVADGTGVMAPTNSIIQVGDGAGAATNSSANPAVVASYNTEIAFQPWRTNPPFVGAIMITVTNAPSLLGNYHLSGTGSPAYNTGAASKAAPSYQQPPATLAAPTFDIDNLARPAGGAYDKGADEVN